MNAGALAPVADEVALEELPVSGRLPHGLDGTLIRCGPNPLGGRFAGSGVLDWWPEAAMWHAVDLRAGRATDYRNRWARTRRWAEAKAPERVGELIDTNPNINVIDHAGEVLALAEGGAPLAITRRLETIGPSTIHPALASGSNAHPKLDPETGELMSFAAGWAPPYLRYMVSGPDGATRVDTSIELPGPVMIHDLAITTTRSIVLDLNVGLDLSMLDRGYRIPVRWRDDKPARLGVIPRHGGPATWLEIEPCFVQHVVNAFDDGASMSGATSTGASGAGHDTDRVVLDAVRYPWYFRAQPEAGGGDGFDPDPLGVLWRWELDLTRGTVTEGPLDEANIELPRIDESRTGRPYRHLYAVEQPTTAEMRGLRRHDLATGDIDRWVPPPGDQNSEPVFVARPGTGPEGDGWILACVYRAASDTTDVVVLEAGDLAAGPIAAVHLPRRIPAGFHGAWLPAN